MQSARAISRTSKKRRGDSQYPFSVEADAVNDGKSIPVKLVFVSTDASLTEKEMIKTLEHRGIVQVLFEALKGGPFRFI